MNTKRRYVMQVGETVRHTDSFELAAEFVARRLLVPVVKLRGQLLKSGVAVANVHGRQGYVFDTQYVTNDREE